jgi:VCBS repeat-containing protein
VAGDTNDQIDVFVKDLQTGEITNVTQGGNRGSGNLNLSADGAKVAFHSYASNLVAGDTNGTYDVFVATLNAPSPNRAPEAQTDKTLTVLEDAEATILGITSPTDPDGDDLTITVTALPTTGKGAVYLTDGTVVLADQTLSASQLAGLTFKPTADANGAAGTFAYSVSDGSLSASQTVTLAITPVNDAPTLKADPLTVSVYEDASTTNLWNMIVGNGHDVEGDALTISTIDTTGTVGSVSFDKAGKKLVYTADDNLQDLLQSGDTDTTVVKYKLSDGREDTFNWGTLNIDVKGVLEPNSAGLYIGTSKADVMQGSPTADKMIGAGGDDLMIGAGGDDWMNGAEGRDIFLLGAGFGKDTIINFDRGQDVIDAREFFDVNNHTDVFNRLDQNGDGAIDASDSNVSWGKGRMTVTFDTDGVNSLTLVGVQELNVTDFEHTFIA